MDSSKKQDDNIQHKITKEQTDSNGLLRKEVQKKKEIKIMTNTTKLKNLSTQIPEENKKLLEKITELSKFRQNHNLSISQKIKIDELIKQLRAKYMKYTEALLRIQKRLA